MAMSQFMPPNALRLHISQDNIKPVSGGGCQPHAPRLYCRDAAAG